MIITWDCKLPCNVLVLERHKIELTRRQHPPKNGVRLVTVWYISMHVVWCMTCCPHHSSLRDAFPQHPLTLCGRCIYNPILTSPFWYTCTCFTTYKPPVQDTLEAIYQHDDKMFQGPRQQCLLAFHSACFTYKVHSVTEWRLRSNTVHLPCSCPHLNHVCPVPVLLHSDTEKNGRPSCAHLQAIRKSGTRQAQHID